MLSWEAVISGSVADDVGSLGVAVSANSTAQTNATTTTTMNDEAAKALMKIANSTTHRVPEMKDKHLSVEQTSKHIKDFVKAKEK